MSATLLKVAVVAPWAVISGISCGTPSIMTSRTWSPAACVTVKGAVIASPVTLVSVPLISTSTSVAPAVSNSLPPVGRAKGGFAPNSRALVAGEVVPPPMRTMLPSGARLRLSSVAGVVTWRTRTTPLPALPGVRARKSVASVPVLVLSMRGDAARPSAVSVWKTRDTNSREPPLSKYALTA